MIRTLVTPTQPGVFVKMPEDFVGKQVEVIAFVIEDTLAESVVLDKPLTYFASEKTLTKDWLTPEEDQAWQNL